MTVDLFLPANRVETYFYEKLEKKKRDKMTNTECLGQTMIDASNAFGPGTSYGECNSLVKTRHVFGPGTSYGEWNSLVKTLDAFGRGTLYGVWNSLVKTWDAF